jgi:dTMP kinase
LRELLLDPGATLTPLTELFVFCAARAEHVSTVIRPALAAGTTVLSDRFADASLAYQGYGRGIDLAVVRACTDAATDGLRPDLTLLVDLPAERSADRVAARAGATGDAADRLEREGGAFHRRVRDGYLAIARAEPARVRVLDGTLAPDALLAAAWDQLVDAGGFVG